MTSRPLHLTLSAFVVAVAGVSAVTGAPQNVPEDFVITIERMPCFLQCPVYSVSIDAHGGVTYEGVNFVRVKGHQADRVPGARVSELYELSQSIGFFDLRDRYRTIRAADGSEAVLTDIPGIVLTVTAAGRTKRVEDYFGAPERLKDLERQVEQIARTNRWVTVVQHLALASPS